MSEVRALTLSERCRALAEECRSKARSFRNIKPRTQMFQLASDYERKANLAEELEISLRTPYNQDTPLNKQIAAALGIGEKTVKVYRGRMHEKMGVRRVPDLVRMTALVSQENGGPRRKT